MSMSSNGAGPWKIASGQSSSSRSADTRSFPPLSSKGPTKKQTRLRAIYTQTPHFNPYTPRVDQINRQELERLHLRYTDEDVIAAPNNEDEASSVESIRQSSISNIIIKDSRGNILGRGADRHKSPNKYKRSFHTSQANTSNTSSTLRTSRITDRPAPFTDSNLESLLSECHRRQRAMAAEQRQNIDSTNVEDPNQPFTDKLIKAFASLDGFLSAFSKESIEGQRVHEG